MTQPVPILDETLAGMRWHLAGHFSLDELKDLALDLGIVYDELPHDTRGNLARELVAYCERQGKLDELQTRIREWRPREEHAVAAALSLHQLPSPPGDFTGREAELAELCERLGAGATISGLQGLGGVGKTALALKLAEALMPRYPDAQFFLDLRGTTTPLSPAEVMGHVIRGYHPTAKLPESVDELHGLYCSVLHGQRALLVMDNARDAGQVEPLIPPAGCALLVTSRWHFALPGLLAKNLDALPAENAEGLLLKIAPRIDGHAGEMAKLCGYLPLALRLAGTALAERMTLSVGEYVRRLQDAQRRLELVEASLTLSYELLTPELQRLWGMLSVFPGTFDRAGAAAVWGMDAEPAQDAAQDALDELVRYSLVEWNEAAGRYSLHDLVRVFAGARLDGREWAAAEQRHAGYYEGVLRAADELYMQGGESIMRGLRLFDLEWGNIQVGQARAAMHIGEDDQAARLCSGYPKVGAHLLSLRQHPRGRIQWLEVALTASQRLGQQDAGVGHLNNLGSAYFSLGQYEQALHYCHLALTTNREIDEIDKQIHSAILGNLGDVYTALSQYEQAKDHYLHGLAIAREAGDKHGESNHLSGLGHISYDQGQYETAIKYFQQALEIAREIDNLQGEGSRLGNLGAVHDAMGRYELAVECYQQALAVIHEIGDMHQENALLGQLGLSLTHLGRYTEAIRCFEKALAISREIGDRHFEGYHVGNLGFVHHEMGQFKQAICYHEQALTISREIGDRRGEGYDLGHLGIANLCLGRYEQAIDFCQQALAIRREIGDKRGEGLDLGNLGAAYVGMEQYERAIAYLELALAVRRQIDDLYGQGLDLLNLGSAYLKMHKYEQAIDYFQQSQAICREIGDRSGEATAIGSLGLTYAALGDARRATEFHEQALAIAREIGDRQGETQASWNLGEVYERGGDLVRAAALMQHRVDYECEIGHPDAEKHATIVEELRARLESGSNEGD
jgi:tetratricopeptide (TPR) repeat protein